MARRKPASSVGTFEERAGEFVLAHRRILSDFERSLKNARHFIKLAGRSMEREPEATITMLEQVREIDLLRHVTHQHEEYLSVAAMLFPALAQTGPASPAAGQQAEIESMRARYDALMLEAESQAEEMERLLSALQTPH